MDGGAGRGGGGGYHVNWHALDMSGLEGYEAASAGASTSARQGAGGGGGGGGGAGLLSLDFVSVRGRSGPLPRVEELDTQSSTSASVTTRSRHDPNSLVSSRAASGVNLTLALGECPVVDEECEGELGPGAGAAGVGGAGGQRLEPGEGAAGAGAGTDARHLT